MSFESPRLFDISMPLSDASPVWPGDESVRYRLNWSREGGAAVNLGSISTTVHAGTHADAPFHVDSAAFRIGALDLNAFLGPAVVVDVRGRERIESEDLRAADLEGSPRLLLRTGGWPDRTLFPTQFPVMAADVPGYLASRGVCLVGIDMPSVDLFHSKDLPNHHALNAHGIRILESLQLDGVPGRAVRAHRPAPVPSRCRRISGPSRLANNFNEVIRWEGSY